MKLFQKEKEMSTKENKENKVNSSDIDLKNHKSSLSTKIINDNKKYSYFIEGGKTQSTHRLIFKNNKYI